MALSPVRVEDACISRCVLRSGPTALVVEPVGRHSDSPKTYVIAPTGRRVLRELRMGRVEVTHSEGESMGRAYRVRRGVRTIISLFSPHAFRVQDSMSHRARSRNEVAEAVPLIRARSLDMDLVLCAFLIPVGNVSA